MTELLKVLKFMYKRALLMFKLIRYKGVYAFLGGIMVVSVCFGQINTLNAKNIEESPTAVNSGNASGTALLEGASGQAESETESENPLKPVLAVLSEIKPLSVLPEAEDEEIISLLSEPEISEETEEEPAFEDNTENILKETRFVNKNGIYSREEGAEGAVKVKQYSLNETVVTVGEPENEYYELEDGSFIHSDFLSLTETPKWIEEPFDSVMYVNQEGIFSREEGVEGSVKVRQLEFNEKVTVCAKTDTGYFKLDSGEFVHSDFLSDTETPKWIEEPFSGIMYVSKNGIYSRAEGVEGSEKIQQYTLNDTVDVVASTNTGYYKLDSGEFIHSDYLSPVEIVEYPLSIQYGQRNQTDWEKELARQVFDIVNSVRAEYGLQPFAQLDSLTAAAVERAWETTFYNSHTRPDGTRCFTVLNEYGLGSPSAKAENIAMWSSSAQAVVNAWMNDYAHRKAILGDFQYMGVGCYYIDGDYYGYYWSQLFYTP